MLVRQLTDSTAAGAGTGSETPAKETKATPRKKETTVKAEPENEGGDEYPAAAPEVGGDDF